MKQRGFTLIELLVVIAIVSLMASVGSGMFLGTFERLKVNDGCRTAKAIYIMFGCA